MEPSHQHQTRNISTDLGDPCVDNIDFPASRCLEKISDLINVLIAHYEIYRCLMGVVSSLGIFVVRVWRCGCQPFKYLLKRNIDMRRQTSTNYSILFVPIRSSVQNSKAVAIILDAKNKRGGYLYTGMGSLRGLLLWQITGACWTSIVKDA